MHAGEIVGIAGVSGNGQQELLAALSGEDRRARPGSVVLLGADVARASARPRAAGWARTSCRRSASGAAPCRRCRSPTTRSSRAREPVRAGGWLDLGRDGRDDARDHRALQREGGRTDAAAQSLSGGNLQKYIVGREIDARPKVLVVAQPTWGVDVGAAAQIRQALLDLRDAGCAVLVVTEELDELFEISDRLASSRTAGCRRRSDRDSNVGGDRRWMSGLWPGAPGAPPVHGEVAHAPA